MTTTGAAAASVPPTFAPLAELLDQVASDPEWRSVREEFSTTVRRELADVGLVRRPTTLAQLLADPIFRMKYREKPAHRPDLDDAAWERFALSLGDSERARLLADLLPALAAVVRLEPASDLVDHVDRQLLELASWSPLMRPGWSGGAAADGAWLGTGWALRAIFWTLAILPADSLPPGTLAALQVRLRAEAAGIREDWRARRSWFIRDEAVYSNQWVLPLEALVLACLRLGPNEHPDDYEFAISGLLRALDAQGSRGEFVEGMEYAAITLHSLYSAARACAEFRDQRLLSHPYLHRFPLWYLHHRQPGGQVINASDNRDLELERELLSRTVTDVAHTGAAWALLRGPGTRRGVFSLAALPLLADLARPPVLFANYPVAARVNWLESAAAFGPEPDNRVSGFWIRGGHTTDAHDHEDRGHVNFVIRGRPALIEAGHASYGGSTHATHFRSVAGHNVLQVGDHAPEALSPQVLAAGAGQLLNPAHRAAPLTVHRLDAEGGCVEFDGSRCYASLTRWTRRVEWNAGSATIVDQVELPAPETILFRWHLGAPADAKHEIDTTAVRIDGLLLSCEASGPVTLKLEAMPDRTLHPDRIAMHATLVVLSAAPTRALSLRTRISLAD